jgi:formylglycine-generating enzyme required for sulfatase activity
MVEKSYRFDSLESLARAIKDEASLTFEPVTKAAPKIFTTLPIEENIVSQPELSDLEAEESIEPESPDSSKESEVLQEISEPELSEEAVQPLEEEPIEPEVEYLIATGDDEEFPESRFRNSELIDTLDIEPLREKRDQTIAEFVMPTPVRPEVVAPEPERSVKLPEPTPVPDEAPKVAAQKPTTREKIVIEIEEDEDESMPRLRKVFVIMSLLSVAIIIFIAIKYYVLRDEPTFVKSTIEEVEEASDLPQLIANDPIEMVIVPADTVIVGSMSPLADEDEFPIKQVRLRSFLMGTKEITQKEWMMVYSTNPSQFLGEDRPVENISYYDAIDFCNEKSILDGLTPCYSYIDQELICDFNANGYRLPTEAEWEHAAKGAARDDYFLYSGADVPFDAGWFNENSGASTNEAGVKIPNALGLYDMSGNVFEWVWNWYSRYSYRMKDVYTGADTGTDKVIRGGSWYHNAHEMRVTNRNFAKPFSKTNYIGFRVVRTVN